MKRLLIHTFFFTILIFFATCDETSQDAKPESEALEFAIEPSEDLRFMIEETPSDFTWEFFSDNLIVTLVPESDWSGEIVLSSFQVENDEVINRASTEPVEINTDVLKKGLSTEVMFPDLVFDEQAWTTNSKLWLQSEQWPQAAEWLQSEHWTPVEQWVPNPDITWNPTKISEIRDAALSEFELNHSETLVVVYTQPADETSTREMLTRPYGIIFARE